MCHRKNKQLPKGANIAGVPIEEPNAGVAIPSSDGNEPYIPRHLAPEGGRPAQHPAKDGEYLPQPDGSHIAPNGAVVRNPWSEQPEIKPDNEYTPEKEDLNLMIM